MEVRDIQLALILVAPGRRGTKPATVDALASSILEIGLQHPIGVVPDGRRFRLVHGRHRLEAFRKLERLEIPSTILDLDDLHAEMAEIDENIQRHQLSDIQEAKALARRKAIYLALHPETKKGAMGGGKNDKGTRKRTESDNLSFTVDTAAKTGKSRRTVERAVEVGEAIPDDVAADVEETPIADNKSELAALAEMEPDEQRKVIKEVKSGKRKSVKKKEEPSFCKDLDALVTRHADKTPWCIIASVLEHKLEWVREQQD